MNVLLDPKVAGTIWMRSASKPRVPDWAYEIRPVAEGIRLVPVGNSREFSNSCQTLIVGMALRRPNRA